MITIQVTLLRKIPKNSLPDFIWKFNDNHKYYFILLTFDFKHYG